MLKARLQFFSVSTTYRLPSLEMIIVIVPCPSLIVPGGGVHDGPPNGFFESWYFPPDVVADPVTRMFALASSSSRREVFLGSASFALSLEMMATSGRVERMNFLPLLVSEPWWATLSTSTRGSPGDRP